MFSPIQRPISWGEFIGDDVRSSEICVTMGVIDNLGPLPYPLNPERCP